MVRHPVPLSVEEELIALYTSDSPGQKRWFTRKFKELEPSQQEYVWTRLEQLGHTRPQAAEGGSTRTIITWSEEEWDRLAEHVWRGRKNEPAETLISLTKKALSHFPSDRRRNIRVINEIKPLVERLTAIDEKYSKFERQLAEVMERNRQLEELKCQLEAKLRNTPSKESILSNLTDEEIGVYFADKVLALLTPDDVLKTFQPETLMSYVPFADMMGHVLKSGVEMLNAQQNQLTAAVMELTATLREKHKPTHGHKPSMPAPRVQPAGRLMKVTVVGLLPEQARIVERRLEGRAQFNFVDKNRSDADSIPHNQDVILLAANFIKHSVQDQAKKKVAGTATKLIVHHGGIDMLIRKLDEALPQLEFAQ